jgi:hypothetical protein
MKTDERIRELFNSNGNFVDSSFIMIAHRLRMYFLFPPKIPRCANSIPFVYRHCYAI